MLTEKRCSRCKETKPLSEFGRDKRTKDGLRYYCKKCANEARKTYYRKKVSENPNHNKEYYEKNRERLLENQQRYLEKNRALSVKRVQKWRANGGLEKIKISRFLNGYWGKSSTGRRRRFRGYLLTQGICLFCGELHPLMLENCHIFKGNDEDLISLCYNCHKKLDKYPMLLPAEFQ